MQLAEAHPIHKWILCLAIGLSISVAGLLESRGFCAGTVYLVVGSDTAIWNAGGTVDVYTRHPHYRQDSFTDTNAPSYQVMDPAWRNQFRDSYGQPIKFTWWMMGGNIYRDADNLNVPLANTMTLHLMKQYHGEAIRQFGDELSLHYHTFRWSDYNGSGTFYWNQTRTFDELRSDFDVTLAQYLLEEDVFPVSFRSGWHFMDQDWQQYLNQLIPYCFHDNYGAHVPWYTNAGPIAGVEDWSRAPTAFVPFHPSTNDYQVPGDGRGWNVRSVKIQSLTQATLDQMFSEASNGVDQVACFWDHLPENFVANITRLGSLLSQATSEHPRVPFRYCTAVEAMQWWRGLTNQVPPLLEVVETTQGQIVTLAITSSVPIFQQRPFVCVRDAFQQYSNVTLTCVPSGLNSWTIELPVPRNLLAKVAVAVTDSAGNLATRTLRYLPDDRYIDYLDPEYTEGQGGWVSTTNAAWGTDARVVSLRSNVTAQAAWHLPITSPGRYHISVQVPNLTNAATNISFSIVAGQTNLLSVLLPSGVAPNQWVFVGSVLLDPALSNRVEMVVSGTSETGRYAVTDVLRLVPALETGFPAVGSQSPPMLFATAKGYLLRFEALNNGSYLLQRASSLTAGWSTLQIVSPPGPGVLEYEDENPPPGQSFYRVVAQ